VNAQMNVLEITDLAVFVYNTSVSLLCRMWIWHFLFVLPCSSYTGQQAVSFEYLRDRFARSPKMDHFGAKWGLQGPKLGTLVKHNMW